MALIPPAETTAHADTAPQPVTLETTRSGDVVHVAVIGQSADPVNVRYRLETSGGAGNRASQSGTASLGENRRSTLIDLRFSAGSDWTARLEVSTEGRSDYAIERTGVTTP